VRPKCRWFFVAALFCLPVLASDDAWAQSEADRAAAQTLFEEGQKLIEGGDTAAACEKFQASQELDPATGTQLNLAACYEKLGKTASAWINFTEIADTGSVDKRRRKFARERAEALEPKLIRLAIEVPDPAPDMTLMRGEVKVPKATWGTAIPVDPGTYDLVAKAPGYLPWRETIEVAGEGETMDVTVPALVIDESAAQDDETVTPEPKPRPDEAEGGSGQTIAGITLLVVGGVGIGVGGVLAGLAHSKASESNDFCGAAVGGANGDECTQEGVDLRSSAQGMQIGYFVSFGVGGAAAIAGLITLLTAPSSSDDGADDVGGITIRPTLGPTGSGFGVAGSF
jgi:serine/threonine-protein kinase